MSAQSEWTARYVAYARSLGETPEETSARDVARYPGGRMAGYIVWHSERLRAFRATKPAPSCFVGDGLTDEGHDAFDAWLAGGAS